MPSSTSFTATPSETGLAYLRQQGITAPNDAELAQAFGLTTAAFQARHPTRAALAHDTLAADLERQKRDHQRLYAHYPTPVERLYGLINYSIEDFLHISPGYLAELAQYPVAWQTLQDHLTTYSTPQLHQLLNEGIRQGFFRSDINIQLVTIILIQQVNIVLTPGIFPAGSFQVAEIFRSIFLYYIRGLCTEAGAQLAAAHFARI